MNDASLRAQIDSDKAKREKYKRVLMSIQLLRLDSDIDDIIKENSMLKKEYESNPLNQNGMAPKLVDEDVFKRNGFEGYAFELPAPINQWFIEYVQNVRIIKWVKK
ncbi:hypothetical protein [uncultured Streptococcus sp.]|uniref:hypothetical protein n=1 Tax=uncultured Streptococcus sp. TaxID=83427 RepID=UPI002880796B|nr:hypothetical protein [uncultured Streptococcus sp.]